MASKPINITFRCRHRLVLKYLTVRCQKDNGHRGMHFWTRKGWAKVRWALPKEVKRGK